MTARPATAPLHAKDVLRNGLKEKLARGEVAVSMTVRLVRSPEIAQIASGCGFDSLYVEMQHSSFSEADVSGICQAALPIGITPLVRVPGLRSGHIGRVLDGGALGVIVPDVQTADDVRQAVAAASFPPLGDRSAPGAQLHQLRYRSFPATEAYEALNEATMIVAMLENVEALGCIDEIAAVDGLDMVFVGTSDLTNSMKIPGQLDHLRIRDAYARVIEACQRHGKHVGIGGLAGKPDLIARYLAMGARFVSAGTDLTFLLSSGTARAQQMHNLCC